LADAAAGSGDEDDEKMVLGVGAAAGPGAAPWGEGAGDDDGMAHVPDWQYAMVSQPHWRRPLATSVARGAPAAGAPHVEVDGDEVGPALAGGVVAGPEPADQRRRVVAAGPALAGVGGEEVHQHQRLGRGVHGLRFGPAGAPAINQALAAVCSQVHY